MKKHLLGGMLGACLSLWNTADAAPQKLTLFSLNILAESPKDGYRDWSVIDESSGQRLETGRVVSVLKFIQQQNADIVSLQEMHPVTWADVSRGLSARYIGYPPALDTLGTRWQTAMFFSKDRFALLDSGWEYLHTESWFPGNRAVAWIKLFDVRTGQTFVMMSTHWMPDGRDAAGALIDRRPARLLSSIKMTELIRRFPADIPVILTGDYNDRYKAGVCGDGDCSLDRLLLPEAGGFSIVPPVRESLVVHVLYRGLSAPASKHIPTFYKINIRTNEDCEPSPLKPDCRNLPVTDHPFGIRSEFVLNEQTIDQELKTIELADGARLESYEYLPSGDIRVNLTTAAGSCSPVIDHKTNDFETLRLTLDKALTSGFRPVLLKPLDASADDCPQRISAIGFRK